MHLTSLETSTRKTGNPRDSSVNHPDYMTSYPRNPGSDQTEVSVKYGKHARGSKKKLKYRVRSYENLRRRRQIKTGYVHIMELTNLFQLGSSEWFNSTYNCQ